MAKYQQSTLTPAVARGSILWYLTVPGAELQFSWELFGEKPFNFKESINLFLFDAPFIFKALNPFP